MLDKIKSIKQKFGIVGNSNSLNHAIQVATQVAPTDMTVLITGESGTGKENIPIIKIIFQSSQLGNCQAPSKNLADGFSKIEKLPSPATKPIKELTNINDTCM